MFAKALIMGSSQGAVPLWTPAELGASLAMWLDADDASTITLSGSNVTQWDDKSGNGKDVSQGTASRQPTYDAVNKVITFDGTDDVLVRTDSLILGGANRSIFFVSQSAFGGYAFDHGEEGYGGGRYSIRPNTGFIGFYLRNLQWSTIGDANLGIFEFVQTGSTTSNVSGYWNGQLYSRTGAAGLGGAIDTRNDRITVGAAVSLTATLDGDIAEVVVVNTDTDTATREKIEGYLAWKWGLEGNLPVSHPYKSAPPQL